MKYVLLSIRPRHFKKIAVREKGVEARKAWPKIDPPFKCLIYCTKDEKLLYSDYCGFEITDPNQDFLANGKVVAEFVCNQICAVLAHPSIFAGKPLFFQKAIDDACLTPEEVKLYSGGKDVAGLVISDLKVYDKPKDLIEFAVPCREYQKEDPKCGNCDCYRTMGEYPAECACDGSKPILRPPQNWCYVEKRSENAVT